MQFGILVSAQRFLKYFEPLKNYSFAGYFRIWKYLGLPEYIELSDCWDGPKGLKEIKPGDDLST